MAAASLLLRMLEVPALAERKILVLDPAPFSATDKTWCFWEKGNGFFESLVEKSWSRAWFHGHEFSKEMHLLPYRYKMIRSRDFFAHTQIVLRGHPNVIYLAEHVDSISEIPGGVLVQTTSGSRFESTQVFSSIPPEIDKKPDHFYLLQHFAGWFVESDQDVFDPERPVLMDFSIRQEKDCRFIYLLPFNSRKALVEFTVFSENLMDEEEYQAALASYMKKFEPANFRILEKEKGIIPMFSEPFPSSSIPGLMLLGTCGNKTKASTGYTFQMVQKHSEAIVNALKSGSPLSERTFSSPARFAWFDRVLLRVLSEKKIEGRSVFEALFQKNPVHRVFRFLDEDSTPGEEFLLMNTVPIRRFLLPGIKELLR